MVTGERYVKPGKPVELSATVVSTVTLMSGELGPVVTTGESLEKKKTHGKNIFNLQNQLETD